MTGDARRLLAWKGLGGTPATVFTITFPPTVAERHKEEQINNWDRKTSLASHVCKLTSLDGCTHGGIFYSTSL